jgi:hypothetical protein
MSRHKRVLLWTGLLVVLTGIGMVGVRWLTTPPPGVPYRSGIQIEKLLARRLSAC